MRKLIENIDFTIDVNKLPAKLRYRRRLRGGGGWPGWCHPRVEAVREVDTPGQEVGVSAHGQVSPGQVERAQFRTASFGGQSCRSADGFHHSGDNYCTTGYGQLLTYTDNQRTAGVPQKRTYRLGIKPFIHYQGINISQVRVIEGFW